MIIDLVECDSEILHTKLEKFDFGNPPIDPVDLSKNLAETMLKNNGIGLAANQCGLPYRVFVIKANPIIACFNPIIVDKSEETIYLEEGCLSYPGLFVKIKRPKKIKVRYTEPNGNVVTKVFDGLTSRVFQHELDHLDGIAHISRATAFHKEQAFKKLKKLKNNPKLVARENLSIKRKAEEAKTWIENSLHTRELEQFKSEYHTKV